jgi:DNA-directed RNA polymerase omega subunit
MKRIEDLECKFRFVHAAARRTRQLQSGAQPHIHTAARKSVRIAIEEVLGGAVTFEALDPTQLDPPQEEKLEE